MIVPENPSRHDYVGNAVTTQFPFTFAIRSATEIEVLLDGVAPSANYSVSGVGNENGGVVVFGTAPAANVKITLLRKQPVEQQSVYTPNEDFPAKRLENDLGKIVSVLQMFAERFRRTLAVAKHVVSQELTLPAPESGKAIRWKADLSGFENFEIGSGAIATPLAIAAGGTGATTIGDAQTNLGITGQGQLILASQVFGH